MDIELKKLRRSRGRALAALTLKQRKIDELLNSLTNFHQVRTEIDRLQELFEDFGRVHYDYHGRLDDNSREQAASSEYYEDIAENIEEYCTKVEQWLQNVRDIDEKSGLASSRTITAEEDLALNDDDVELEDDEINPDDSASQISQRSRSSNRSVQLRRAELVRLKELEARVAVLQERQRIEEEELRLRQRQLDLKFEKEKLRLRSEIADSTVSSKSAKNMPKEIKRGENLTSTRVDDPSRHDAKTCAADYSRKILEEQNNIFKEIIHHQQKIGLPQRQMPTFDGDPLQYRSFIRAFETLIEAKEPDPASRLYYLEQYTSGRVQELVRSCLHISDPYEGFIEARRTLERRFGDSHKIAIANIEKLTSGPQIKADDAYALESFSITLNSCKNSLQAIGYRRKIDNPDYMKKIIQRLPYRLQERWRDVAGVIMNERMRDVTIDDITEFVEKQARSLNNPIFGKTTQEPRSHIQNRRPSCSQVTPRTHPSHAHKSSFAAHVIPSVRENVSSGAQRTITCVVCESNHQITECPKFKSMELTERLDIVKKNHLCFGCLRRGHQLRTCYKRKPCTECNQKHSTLLHSSTTDDVKETTALTKDSIASDAQEVRKHKLNANTSSHLNAATLPESEIKTLLPVVPLKVWNVHTDQHVDTYALLNSGSTSTFCTDNLAKLLHVNGERTKIKLATLGSNESVETKVVRNLKITDLDGNNTIYLQDVLTRTSFPVSSKEIPTQEDIDAFPQLRDHVHLPLLSHSDVELIIGVDVPKALQPLEVISTPEGTFATKVCLGWAINGPTGQPKNQNHTSLPILTSKSKLCQGCADSIDAYDDTKIQYSEEETKFLKAVEGSVKHLDNKHYEVALPLKEHSVNLPNNKIQAERRASYLKKRMKRDMNFKDDYVTSMSNTINKGYAERVPEHQQIAEDGRTWYIPHHGVYHKKKPGKLRVVYDCSSKSQDVSLNDALMQGPDLTNNLIGVLLRFRQESIALMADIEGMFHQVVVPEIDRSLLRFLWWTDGKLDTNPDEYQMTVHPFGTVSSPSVANFVLRKTANDNKDDFDEDVSKTVLNNFYVDDCLKSVSTEENAIQLSSDLCELLSRGGFKLTKWMSNSRKALLAIPESERAKEMKDFDFVKDRLPAERALGVHWDAEEDILTFKISLPNKPCTRRGLLSAISSVYDPLGMAIPFVLTAKIMLQDLTRQKLKWDQELSQTDQRRWEKWKIELAKLPEFHLSRCIKPTDFGIVTSYQLHHFSDASSSAYGSVSYLRMNNDKGRTHCSFVFGKSRLAPLKQLTIPKLELAGATLSVRADKMIKSELEVPLTDSIFWTDSMLVIRYIEDCTKKYHTYVANRVAFIRNASNAEQWRYVNTDCNPADQCTRALPIDKFLQNRQWSQGPEYLWKPEHDWPKRPLIDDPLSNDSEVKTLATSYQVKLPEHQRNLNEFLQGFSPWHNLKKFFARILRCQRLIHGNKKSHAPKSDLIKLDELKEAELCILRHVQRTEFREEVDYLQKKGKVKGSSRLRKLNPVLIEGLLRVGGRISRSPLTEEEKHPIILPKISPVTVHIIIDMHKRSGHSGREYVLSLVRQRFWVVNGTSAVRQVLSKCFQCKTQHSKPGNQQMADLPRERVTPEKAPFTYTGIDYFGPFYVKVKRSTAKRYGVIFTCLVIRAVHLEIAHSLDTDSFIMALRRFVARRGQAKALYSDNGTNLIGGYNELRESISRWNQLQIHDFLLQKDIEWHFNPPSGSHFGGVWERCIRTVRKILNALTKEQILTDESLMTLMTEVEGIINGRPITTTSTDPRDDNPITPNHLLLMKEAPALPPGSFDTNDVYSRKRWRQIQYMANLFWTRWKREYLPCLQTRVKWKDAKRNLATNDLVLVVDENLPRNSWLLGRIITVFPDEKGQVRFVNVKTKKGTIRRPITKLCYLEQV